MRLLSCRRLLRAYNGSHLERFGARSSLSTHHSHHKAYLHTYNARLRHNARSVLSRELRDRNSTPWKANFLIKTPRYDEILRMMNDKKFRAKYFSLLLSSESLGDVYVEEINTHFSKLIDIVSGFSTDESLTFLFGIWKSVFSNTSTHPSITKLKALILEHRRVFINILINTKNYAYYVDHVLPLYEGNELKKLEKDWTDKVMETLAMETKPDGELVFDEARIHAYLKNQNIPIATRRKMLTIFLKKCLLHSNETGNYYIAIKAFLTFLRDLNDDDLLLVSKEHEVYLSALRMIITVQTNIDLIQNMKNIARIISSVYEDDMCVLNFVTSLMNSLVGFKPRTVIKLWHFKNTFQKSPKDNQEEVNSSLELTLVMNSYCATHMYENCLNLYKDNQHLHHDDQIQILLKVCEKSKNIKQLQKTFEDMYGRGELPYVTHYALVMNVLASMGSTSEVEKLFQELSLRNLIPNESVYGAMIKSQGYNSNLEAAKTWFRNYLLDERLTNRKANEVELLMFQLHFLYNDLDICMNHLHEVLDIEKEYDIKILDSKIMAEFINFCGSLYGLKQIEYLLDFSKKSKLDSQEVYESVIRAYTRLDQYEKAEQVINMCHLKSNVPFNDPNILKLHIRNLRFWYTNTTDFRTRRYIQEKSFFIKELVNDKNLYVRYTEGLFIELIKLSIHQNDIDGARAFFELSKSLELISENLFTPFLKYFSRQNTFASCTEVLQIYKNMTKFGLSITSKTYVHLLDALLYLDGHNKKGYNNSFKLLKSVLELNGISVDKTDHITSAFGDEFQKNAINLSRMVTAYVSSERKGDRSLSLLVRFLDGLKRTLNTKLSTDFKFYIYREMAGFYIKQGDLEGARALISNALNELHDILERYKNEYPYDVSSDEVRVPRSLQYEYRILIDLKFKAQPLIIDNTDTLFEILHRCHEDGVTLSGPQYVHLLSTLLNGKNPEHYDIIWRTCEAHLVSGNWAEAQFMRKLQYLYKITMLHLTKKIGFEAVFTNYEVLNKFYNIFTIDDLHVLPSKLDPLDVLREELVSFNKQYSNVHEPKTYWTVDRLINNLPLFFSPEVRLPTQNKIPPFMADMLWGIFKWYYEKDKLAAFSLMDNYPDTVEFLLYYGPSKVRLSVFRQRIDSIQPPPLTERKQDFTSRRIRTISVLTNMIPKSFA